MFYNYTNMNLKQLFIVILLSSLGIVSQAQALNDVTNAYLKNPGFDSDYDYAVGATGNVAQQMLQVKGWTMGFDVNYTISGVYQLGTAKTFNGTAVPKTGANGTSTGGCLALSTGWTQSLNFYQTVTLPAGTYTLRATWYNNTDKTAGKSLLGWIPASGSSSLSTLNSFANKTWITDEVTFTLTKTTTGKIQIGYGATLAKGSGEHAKVVLDYIQLLRNTPFGKVDADAKKELLLTSINQANQYYGTGTGHQAAALKTAIKEAQRVYHDDTADMSAVINAIEAIDKAIDKYLWANPTGAVPTVTTNKRFMRGATMAFGRMSTNGSGITERGFCYSTSPEPTINDHRSTLNYTQNGTIYWIKNLTPATKYYMRAYAITKGRQVGYGEVIKFYTLPKGQITYTLRNGDSSDGARARIDAAMKDAVNYWNNLTNIKGFTPNVGYESGTPTADCSYGGWIRVGSNHSYQRIGTMMHEMLHGIGVGTHVLWYGPSEMRAGSTRGYWYGERANELVRFLNNDDNARLTGDHIHLWPYGINGAHEDTGAESLYMSTAMMAQAIGEDGLPISGGFCNPYYAFEQEDNVKYYLKNESTERGLYTAFLCEQADGSLAWTDMSATAAASNDHTAWNITFNPNTCYYALRNVATGHYLSYTPTGNFEAVARPMSLTSNEYFQLMKGRVNVLEGTNVRGYSIIQGNNKPNPYCMQASLNGKVVRATYNISNSANKQRWLILTAEEATQFENKARDAYAADLENYLQQIEKLVTVPHTEEIPGTDQTLAQQLSDIRTQATATQNASEVNTLIKQARSAGHTFLCNVTAKSLEQPFDLTFMMQNADLNATDGWSGQPTLNYGCAEYYQQTFDFYQTLTDLPKGTYRLAAQAFQRPGSASESYTAYLSDAEKNITTYLYANSESVKVKNICAEAQSNKAGVGSESAVGSSWVPNDMQSAATYFSNHLYNNQVTTLPVEDGGSLRLGIRCTSQGNSFWSIFDNFRLYFYGQRYAALTHINHQKTMLPTGKFNVYTIDGHLVRRQATSLDGLPSGIYIVNGKKYVR